MPLWGFQGQKWWEMYVFYIELVSVIYGRIINCELEIFRI